MGDKEGGGRRGTEALPEEDTRGRGEPGVQGGDEERRGDTGGKGDRSASALCPLRSAGKEVGELGAGAPLPGAARLPAPAARLRRRTEAAA